MPKAAAAMLRCTPEQALLGFVAKHLTSVIDMVQSGRQYPLATWDEKLGDVMVYFALLDGIVQETLAGAGDLARPLVTAAVGPELQTTGSADAATLVESTSRLDAPGDI